MLRVSHVIALSLALGNVAYADDNRDRALKLFEDSNKAYKSGKFEDAADLLRKAYELYPEPILLYNLGRAQEGLGDRAGALESYERYLAEAKQVDDRGAIERRIATLREQLETEAKLRDQPPPPPPPPVIVDDRTPVEKYGPWVTIGTGGALIITGAVFGVRAGAKHDDAIAAPGQRDAADLQASAEKYATIANVLFVVGGLATAGGIGWKVWQHKQTTVQVAPTSVAVHW